MVTLLLIDIGVGVAGYVERDNVSNKWYIVKK